MTIDEVIKRCENEAKHNLKSAEKYHHKGESRLEDALRYDAKYKQQLAEWLKKLQAYEEAREEIIRKRDSGQWSEAVVYGLNHAIYIIDKHLREVNTDEDSD